MIEKSGEPAYLQIADQLRGKILSGELPPDTLLPSTAQLGARYGVSASVVKSAIGILRSEGLVVGQQGKGVYVKQPDEATREPQGSAEFVAITKHLNQLDKTVQGLVARLAELEAKVTDRHEASHP